MCSDVAIKPNFYKLFAFCLQYDKFYDKIHKIIFIKTCVFLTSTIFFWNVTSAVLIMFFLITFSSDFVKAIWSKQSVFLFSTLHLQCSETKLIVSKLMKLVQFLNFLVNVLQLVLFLHDNKFFIGAYPNIKPAIKEFLHLPAGLCKVYLKSYI